MAYIKTASNFANRFSSIAIEPEFLKLIIKLLVFSCFSIHYFINDDVCKFECFFF